jgi:protein SCO1/2
MKSKRSLPARQAGRRAGRAFAVGVALLLLLAGAFAVLMSGARSRVDADVGGPFRLVSDTGRIVTERSFPGKYLLLYFGYTHCPDVCPATLTTLSAALGRLGAKSGRVQALFVTLDPDRDTQAVLHRYVRAFGPALVGLTGAPAELRAIAASYHVMREKPDGGGLIDHSSVIYLMAPDGRFLAPIEADASEMVMREALDRRVE